MSKTALGVKVVDRLKNHRRPINAGYSLKRLALLCFVLVAAALSASISLHAEEKAESPDSGKATTQNATTQKAEEPTATSPKTAPETSPAISPATGPAKKQETDPQPADSKTTDAKSSGAKTKGTKYPKPGIEKICQQITSAADKYNLPRDFFARLIWKESRFDHLAVSPVGAQGIAQFMPGTAKIVGLKDPFDYTQAIPASASHLNDLRNKFGNLGLAAAAYNAGGGRVSNWLYKGGWLPFETEDYVAYVTGEPADNFADKSHQIKDRPLDEKLSFEEACLKLPIILTRTRAMAEINPFPWGIQIAGNFRRNVVERSVNRLKARFPADVKKHKIYIQRRRNPNARRSMYAARLGAHSRGEADKICVAIKRAGGACVVSKN